MSGTAAPDADELLAHADWLRRLARALVGEAAADDVVQDTYEVALTAPPPRGGPIGPWLAGVARNLARMRLRGGARRARREEAVVLPLATPGPDELVARARLQQRVTRIVLELDEPLRSTLLLRYHEGLSAADIARAQGVPAGTVRWRLKQALDRVRAQLDAEHDGTRARWALLMAPLVPPVAAAGRGSLLLKGLAVKTSVKVVGSIAVLAVLALAVHQLAPWRDRSRSPSPPSGGSAGSGSAVAPVARASSGGTLVAGGPGDGAPIYRDDDPRGTLRLEGVVIDDAERGVARARVAIDSAPPTVIETESDGSFVFEGLIARDYRLEAAAENGYAGPMRLRLGPDSEPVTLRLRQGGVLEVAVTERGTGAAVIGAAVELRAPLPWSATTGADGVAILRGVGPSWAPVVVTAAGFAPAGTMVQTTGDPASPVRIAIAVGHGAAVSGTVVDEARRPIAGVRVTVSPASEPFPVVDPHRDGVVTAADGTFTLPAVAAGTHRLTASDGDHAAATSSPFVTDGVAARGDFTLVMGAGGVVEGTVTDGQGQPVAAATVSVLTKGYVEWRARRQAFTDERGRFTMRGLPRRALDVVAHGPGGSSPIAAADLATAPRREVALVLSVTGEIVGTVVDGAGTPVIDAQVIAEPPATGDPASRNAAQVRGVPHAITDGAGAFRFAGLAPGSYRVRAAWPGAHEEAAWQGEGAVASPGGPPVKLVLAKDGRITGTIALPDGKAPAVFAIEWNDSYPLPFAGGDGRFAFDAPAGRVGMVITGAGFVQKRVSATVEPGETTDLGTIQVQPGRSISGRVLDGGGAPVAGATVAAGFILSGDGAALYIEDESVGARSTTTGEDGRFALEGFSPARLTVVAGKDGVGRSSSMQLPRGPDSAVVELVLQPVGSVAGTIVRGGQPLPDTIVIANPIGATGSNFFVSTGPDGSFALDALTPGEYFIYPVLGGGGGRPKDMPLRGITISAGERATITIDATPGAAELAVTLATDAGAPVAMAQVFAVQADFVAPNMESLRDGTFLPAPLRDGATIMMHMRTAMGGALEIEGVRPGKHTVCVIPIPIGDDPAKARELMEQLDTLSMKCEHVEMASGPARLAITVPAAWTQPRP